MKWQTCSRLDCNSQPFFAQVLNSFKACVTLPWSPIHKCLQRSQYPLAACLDTVQHNSLKNKQFFFNSGKQHRFSILKWDVALQNHFLQVACFLFTWVCTRITWITEKWGMFPHLCVKQFCIKALQLTTRWHKCFERKPSVTDAKTAHFHAFFSFINHEKKSNKFWKNKY